MNGATIEDALDTLTIIVDKREQATAEAERRYKCFGFPFIRHKLDFGDYSAFVSLEDGTQISLADKVTIERKMSIDELATCLGTDRARFERELERMKAAEAKMYLLVEGFTWEKVLMHRYKSKMHPNAVIGTLEKYFAYYNINFIACDKMTSGSLIAGILKKEMETYLCSLDRDI